MPFKSPLDQVAATISQRAEEDELRRRRDLDRLDDEDAAAYQRLTSNGKNHDDAIFWIDTARPFRQPLRRI